MLHCTILKEAIMTRPIDIPAIERHARQLRAEEMQRLQGVLAERLGLYGLLLARSLLVVLEVASEWLRPWFSWNPQRRHPG
jgi:hypothetical protein